jgi:hypothetical protein
MRLHVLILTFDLELYMEVAFHGKATASGSSLVSFHFTCMNFLRPRTIALLLSAMRVRTIYMFLAF